MFVLYEMTRDVRIEPVNLGLDRVDAIRDELNRKFSNRVVYNVGLAIVLWDIKSIGPGFIFTSDGGVHSKVKFRYVIFRPFQDEIIVGKIKNCTPDGVHVTLGFFDDILIPPEALQYPSRFDEREQIWIWEYQKEDDEEPHEMYMDKGESIRFRVTAEIFTDTTPVPSGPPPAPPNQMPGTQASSSAFVQQQVAAAAAATTASTSEEEEASSKVPYSITATINEPGLGLLSWWN